MKFDIKDPKTIYILVGAFCVIAIISAIISQAITSSKPKTPTNNLAENTENTANSEENVLSQENVQTEAKEKLNSLITNNILVNNYDTRRIQKIDNEKEIVYTAFDINRLGENYEIDIRLPVINIQNPVAIGFNDNTQAIFVEKIKEIINSKEQEKTIYTTNYSAYVNENILSVIIKSSLKSGNSNQRIIIQTYNYNLDTGEAIKLDDILSQKNIIQSECKEKIKQTIEKAKKESEVLANAGYTVYKRDTTSTMYLIPNITTFLVGPNKSLYIIFPYGNQHFTSEMDIVLYE